MVTVPGVTICGIPSSSATTIRVYCSLTSLSSSAPSATVTTPSRLTSKNWTSPPVALKNTRFKSLSNALMVRTEVLFGEFSGTDPARELRTKTGGSSLMSVTMAT